MNTDQTREALEGAVEDYGRESVNAAESFRSPWPTLDAYRDALARHEAAIKAEAWDEGHSSGIAFQAGNNSPHAYTNPYKEAAS